MKTLTATMVALFLLTGPAAAYCSNTRYVSNIEEARGCLVELESKIENLESKISDLESEVEDKAESYHSHSDYAEEGHEHY